MNHDLPYRNLLQMCHSLKFFSLYFGLFWLLVIIEKEVRDRRGAEHWWRSSGCLLFRHFF